MVDDNCLFCKIGQGIEPAKIIFETEDFLCIENKYPVAPIHVLVIPKAHRIKTEWVIPSSAKASERSKLVVQSDQFWGKIMAVVFQVICQLGLDKTGYKLVNNGAGYNHFDHEHMHILGGSKLEPGGAT